MRFAIVSDIHSNRQAWSAVRRDIRAQGVDITICLGDVVGYGPMPEEVLESVCEEVNEIIIGNHDAVIGGRLGQDIFSEEAQRYIDWTRDQLDESAVSFFADLPTVIEGDSFTMAHAELFDPERYGYIEQIEEAQENFAVLQKGVLFVGHTHCPGVFEFNPFSRSIRTMSPADLYFQPDIRYIVNVGSVGDPRDDNPLASYLIFDEDEQHVTFRRLDFDMAGYQADLSSRQVTFKPWFLSRLSGKTQPPTPGRDWAIQVRKAPKHHEEDANPLNRVRLGHNLSASEQAESTASHARREEMARALRQASEEAEIRRLKRAEATKEALRKRQEAAEEIRLQQEQERLATEAVARERKMQLALIAAQNRQERELQRQAETQLIAERLRAKQQAVAAARQEEERAKEMQAMAEQPQQAAAPAASFVPPQTPNPAVTGKPRIELALADDQADNETDEPVVAEVAQEAPPVSPIPLPATEPSTAPSAPPTDPAEIVRLRKAQLLKAAEEKRLQRRVEDDVRRQRIRAAIEQKRVKAQGTSVPPNNVPSTESPPEETPPT